MSSRLNLSSELTAQASTAQPSWFSLPVGLEGNHGIPPLLRKNHTAGESLFGVQGTSRRQTGGCMHHLPDEACLPDGCSVLPLSRSLFAHTSLSAQERRRMLGGWGGQRAARFPASWKNICAGSIPFQLAQACPRGSFLGALLYSVLVGA